MESVDQKQSLAVKVWGCRGSMAVAGRDFVKYGGNTTCYEIMSRCLPPRFGLFCDSGTGIFPAGDSYLSRVKGGYTFMVLQTHYHTDHVFGSTFFRPIFNPEVSMTYIGPMDSGSGPKNEIINWFKRPRFPVDSESVLDRMNFLTLESFDVKVIVVHPRGGWQILRLSEFVMLERGRKQVRINHNRYDLNECMVIRMHRANHGNATCITYRFEERPTGRVLVICTDHENPDEIPRSLLTHFRDANLLVMDAQYNQKQFEQFTAGFGHGTPRGVARQALAADVEKIVLVHHDPGASDTYLETEIEALTLSEAYRFSEMPEFRRQYGFGDAHTFKIFGPTSSIRLGADYETYDA